MDKDKREVTRAFGIMVYDTINDCMLKHCDDQVINLRCREAMTSMLDIIARCEMEIEAEESK